MNKIEEKKLKRIERITIKLQYFAEQIHDINGCYFNGCDNTMDILFKLGAKAWMPIMASEGYSEKYCNSSVLRFTNRFLNYFKKVIKTWDELNPELTKKLINKINK